MVSSELAITEQRIAEAEEEIRQGMDLLASGTLEPSQAAPLEAKLRLVMTDLHALNSRRLQLIGQSFH